MESAKSIEDASIKEDVPWGRSVMDKILDVHSQRLVRELVRIRSRTQPAPTAVLDDGARAIADDGVTASLQRQQERGLPCAGAACNYYSRHSEVRRPYLRRLTLIAVPPPPCRASSSPNCAAYKASTAGSLTVSPRRRHDRDSPLKDSAPSPESDVIGSADFDGGGLTTCKIAQCGRRQTAAVMNVSRGFKSHLLSQPKFSPSQEIVFSFIVEFRALWTVDPVRWSVTDESISELGNSQRLDLRRRILGTLHQRQKISPPLREAVPASISN